jgi:hypothetical protein
MHGAGLAVERWWDERRGTTVVRRPWLRWLLTFHLVCLAWVFFRADGLDAVGELAGRLVATGGATTLSTTVLLAIAAGLAWQFLPLQPAVHARALFARLGAVPQGVALGAVLVVTSAVVSGQGVAPFIYYRF